MELEKIPLKLTTHAFDRAKEFRVSVNKVIGMFWYSEPENTPKDLKKRAWQVYRDRQEGVFYRRNGPYVFTAKKIKDRDTNQDIYLLITFCNQEINLKNIKV